MKKSVFAILSIFLCVSFSQHSLADGAPASIAGAKTVNADDVISLLQTSSTVALVDSRVASDYSAGHIEGSINLVDTEMTEPGLAKYAADKSTPVIFYCNGLKCGRAAVAVNKAIGWGYSSVHYYANGMTEWIERGLPVVR